MSESSSPAVCEHNKSPIAHHHAQANPSLSVTEHNCWFERLRYNQLQHQSILISTGLADIETLQGSKLKCLKVW